MADGHPAHPLAVGVPEDDAVRVGDDGRDLDLLGRQLGQQRRVDSRAGDEHPEHGDVVSPVRAPRPHRRVRFARLDCYIRVPGRRHVRPLSS
ncbi:hypothetical protein [Actinoallomurus sp. NPDC052274]|uniref:hypothetical protein n=1 Tax=Actinoallomurus sp. NPDC052274 TaxID=3155420 RepID=UPI0034489C32